MRILLKPLQLLSRPVSYGLVNVPRGGPGLFVGNHTLFGIFDAAIMFLELYTKRDITLRALGDHIHFRIPLWRRLLSRYGVVDGTRENCARLMAARESILVFPGGAREVFKRKGEKYKLIWGERVGFARMAIQHRYPIIPFAAVGAEEAWDIVLDANDLVPAPLQEVLGRLGFWTDALLPIVKGIGPTPGRGPSGFTSISDGQSTPTNTRVRITTRRPAGSCERPCGTRWRPAFASCWRSASTIPGVTCCRGCWVGARCIRAEKRPENAQRESLIEKARLPG